MAVTKNKLPFLSFHRILHLHVLNKVTTFYDALIPTQNFSEVRRRRGPFVALLAKQCTMRRIVT